MPPPKYLTFLTQALIKNEIISHYLDTFSTRHLTRISINEPLRDFIISLHPTMLFSLLGLYPLEGFIVTWRLYSLPVGMSSHTGSVDASEACRSDLHF